MEEGDLKLEWLKMRHMPWVAKVSSWLPRSLLPVPRKGSLPLEAQLNENRGTIRLLNMLGKQHIGV